jgi:putative membrane protein
MTLDPAAIYAIDRPHRSLWKYYVLASFVTGPLFPVFLLLGWIRFSTLRYTFTDEGISMRWGRLFRREIILNYARIQDIHLRSNVVERWLGLSRILIQTASGGSGAEMTIEGLREYEAIRDFLYARMRGVSDGRPARAEAAATDGDPATAGARSGAGTAEVRELAAALRDVALELRATRELLAARGAGGSPEPRNTES